MLATQDSAREGRDDGAKMAAQLRVLPLRGQVIEERIKPKHNKAAFGNESYSFCYSTRKFVMA